MTTADSIAIALCNSADLQERHLAVPFDVVYAGQTCRAFAIRFEGRPHAFLNRCSHVAMEMENCPVRSGRGGALAYCPQPATRRVLDALHPRSFVHALHPRCGCTGPRWHVPVGGVR